MNRAERRRRQREHATPINGVHYSPTAKPSRSEDLSPDAPGKHVWIVTAVHRVSDEGARRAFMAEESVILDRESVVDIFLGCWVCEQVYSSDVADRPCSGPPR